MTVDLRLCRVEHSGFAIKLVVGGTVFYSSFLMVVTPIITSLNLLVELIKNIYSTNDMSFYVKLCIDSVRMLNRIKKPKKQAILNYLTYNIQTYKKYL